MAVHDPTVSRHEMPPGVAMAVARSCVAAVDADRSAVAAVTVAHCAAELGNEVAADVGMTAADRHDQALV